MQLAAWVRSMGVHPKTAYRWYHRGKTLPVPARQLETRTILVTLPVDQPAPTAAIYARVSSQDHRADLDRQPRGAWTRFAQVLGEFRLCRLAIIPLTQGLVAASVKEHANEPN